MKLSPATTITLVLLALCAVLTCILFAVVGLVSTQSDRASILLFGFVGAAAIVLVRLAWVWFCVSIPKGLAGVIVQLGQRMDAQAGPTVVHYLPMFQHVDYFALLQKPLDLHGTYTTKDQVQIELDVSIYYEITLGSVIPHLEKWIDVTGDLTRLTRAWLTTHVSSWFLDDVLCRLPWFAEQLTTYLNIPDCNLGHFGVKQTLFTQAHLPADIVRAKTELKAELTQLLVTRIRADERHVRFESELDARVDEVNKLAPSIGPVDARTYDLVELHTLLDHLENIVKK